jgi:hypothetical protein
MKGAKRYRLLSLLLILLALPTVAYASLLCRSDPKVNLSNGVTLNIGVSVAARLQDITEIDYDLHVPQGVEMTNTIHTPGWAWDVETFTITADQPADQYYVNVRVRTVYGSAPVLAYTIVKDDGKTIYSASGVEADMLTIAFSQ